MTSLLMELPIAQSQETEKSQITTEKSINAHTFDAVTSRLDKGGSFYLFMNTGEILSGLSDKLAQFQSMVTDLPIPASEEKNTIQAVMSGLAQSIRSSGLEEIDGIGVSSILLEPELYQNKFVIHRSTTEAKGFLWSLFGKNAHEFDLLDYFPQQTVAFTLTDLDLPLLWQTAKTIAAPLPIPQLQQFFQIWPEEFEKHCGMSWSQFLNVFDGTFGFCLVFDKANPIPLFFPSANQSKAVVEIPRPAVTLLATVKNDEIIKLLDRLTGEKSDVARIEKVSLKMRVVSSLPQMPIPVKITLAQHGNTLFLSSLDSVVEAMVSVKNGEKSGIKSEENFKKLAGKIPKMGNQLSYLHPAFSQTVHGFITNTLTARAMNAQVQEPARIQLVQKILLLTPAVNACSVSWITPDGIITQSIGNQDISKQMILSSTVAPTAIMAGMLLPALAKSKAKAQQITCVNNMKQIGLAARIWATDHDDKLPKDFLSMKAELTTPKILICPADSKRQPFYNSSWSQMDVSRISSEMISPGAEETDPQKIYVRCPIHGTELYVDGSVRMKR